MATKCGLIWHKQKEDIKVYRCLSPEVIRYEVEQSLRRLKTDYIDLYQTHWQDCTTPIEEIMQTLMAIKKEGKIKSIGCSNATPEQMNIYRRCAALDVDQELYSMLDREHEDDNLPYVNENGISFFAYSSLGQGLLTGKLVLTGFLKRETNVEIKKDSVWRIGKELIQCLIFLGLLLLSIILL